MLYSRPRLGSLTLDLNPSTFRKAAIGLVSVTMMGASALASFPAAAQQLASSYSGSPACSGYVNDGPSLAQCEANQLDVRLKNAKARGAAADGQRSCTQDLMSWAKSDPAKQPLRVKIVNEIRGGKSFDQIDSCLVLERAVKRELNNG
jgi:hypothetical protein